MTISRKELIQLVEMYKRIHGEFSILNSMNKSDIRDLFHVLRYEFEKFGDRNCKNYNSVKFNQAINQAELQNKEDHKSIKEINNYVKQKELENSLK